MTTNNSIELSIVVPAYNEEKTIEEALSRLHQTITESGISFEIILVVDGYVDRTKEIALSLGLSNLRVIGYEKNLGKGHALRVGAQKICGEFAAFFDGDLDIDSKCLVDLFRRLVEQEVDVVVGSKVHPESIVIYPLFRRFQSGVMRLLVRTLFDLDIGDTQTGIKVFRAPSLLATINKVQTNGFSFDVDLLVRMNDQGSKIVEGPIILNYQFSSTTSIKTSIVVLFNLFRLKLQRIKRRFQQV
jgi:glycosyltransferase involved in cell wall biosynthesis